MAANEKAGTILIAEDDDDDYFLTKKAFEDAHFSGSFHRVKDGEELLDYLLRETGEGKRLVVLLLLDLNMPRKDGREALKEIKAHPELRKIPVIVLTTSAAEKDIAMAYECGANSFIRKPESFDRFIEAVQTLTKYWFDVAELPACRGVQKV